MGLAGLGRPSSPLNSLDNIKGATARSSGSTARPTRDWGEASLTSPADCHSIRFQKEAEITHTGEGLTLMKLLKMCSNGYHSHWTTSGYWSLTTWTESFQAHLEIRKSSMWKSIFQQQIKNLFLSLLDWWVCVSWERIWNWSRSTNCKDQVSLRTASDDQWKVSAIEAYFSSSYLTSEAH